MAYGYRLFTVELREGQKRNALKFADTDCGRPGLRYLDYATELLNAHVSKSWMHPTDLPEPALGERVAPPDYVGKPVVRVLSIEKPEPNVLVVTFEYGRVGSHKTALGVPDVTQDASLENLAPSNEFRAFIITPETGTIGILAVESVGRSCPVQPLRALLRDRARHESVDTTDPEHPKVGPWWQLHEEAIVDRTHLEAVLRDQAAETSIELIVKTTSGSRQRGQKPIKISAANLDQARRTKVAKVVRGWVKKAPTDAVGAKQLAAVIGHGIESVDLESGVVRMDAGQEAPVALKPSQLGDVFTYLQPAGNRQTTKVLYGVVRAKVRSISQVARLQVDLPKWE
jgi:hypothetical protein